MYDGHDIFWQHKQPIFHPNPYHMHLQNEKIGLQICSDNHNSLCEVKKRLLTSSCFPMEHSPQHPACCALNWLPLMMVWYEDFLPHLPRSLIVCRSLSLFLLALCTGLRVPPTTLIDYMLNLAYLSPFSTEVKIGCPIYAHILPNLPVVPSQKLKWRSCWTPVHW